MATFTVVNTNDTGAGSLRQAVANANTTAGTDTIVFAPALTGRTIPVGNQIEINEAVTINGPSSNANGIILDGGGDQRIFQVNAAANGVVINNLTITNGSAGGAGGGGLFNSGTTTLSNVVVSNSTATNTAGGIYNDTTGNLTINNSRIVSNQALFGGGLGNFGTGVVTINRSTISANFANGSSGGGIVNCFTMTINASTISGNTATGFGGGGISQEAGTLTVNNSTIAHNVYSNTTGNGGGGVLVSGGTPTLTHVTIANNLSLSTAANSAGGITRTAGTTTVDRSIIAQNLNPSNTANNNTGGTLTTTNSTVTTNRVLGPLQDNGGPTLTMLPLPIVPPIESLNDSPLLTDQRGYPRNVDGNVNGTPFPDRGAVELHPGVPNPYLVTTGPGTAATVLVYNEDGTLQRSFQPYGGYTGGVRATLGDVNGDGIKDIITAPGPGGASTVRVFNGFNGAEIASFDAYGLFTGGVFVAAGDFNNDGREEIVTSPGTGGGPDIRVINISADNTGSTDLLRFLAYDAGFTGGVQVAVATISGVNPDIITAPGPGGGPNVRVFSGSGPINNPTLIGNFNAYASGFTGGVFVGTGDVNGDGQQDIITGPGQGGGPHVRIFDGTTVVNNPNPAVSGNAFPYAGGFTGGVRVSSVDIDGDSFADVITGAGPGGGPHVRIISGRTLTQNLPGDAFLDDKFPVAIGFSGGVHVAGSSPVRAGGSPLRLAEPATASSPGGIATTSDVDALTTAVISQFAQAGLDKARLALLESVSITLTDLEGDLLGLATRNTILIDIDAAGFGFFVDATPTDDIEFQTAGSPALSRVDLLTVIAHELAHVLGLEHRGFQEASGVLTDRLPLGTRFRVASEDLEALDTLHAGDSLLCSEASHPSTR